MVLYFTMSESEFEIQGLKEGKGFEAWDFAILVVHLPLTDSVELVEEAINEGWTSKRGKSLKLEIVLFHWGKQISWDQFQIEAT